MVTGKYFSVLGVSPALGRAIIDSDVAAGAPNVVVISHRFWLWELGGERSAVGRSMTINTVPFTIIGVASPGFTGLLDGAAADLWVPLRPTATLSPWGSRTASTDSAFADRRYWWCTIGGRLKPGVTRSQALAETEHLFRQSITAELHETPVALPALAVSGLSPASDSLRQTFLTPLGILAAGAALVLLIACANVATLLLARAKSRQKEIGPLAIGASRARIIRQLLTESVLLSMCGGVCGFLFVYWGARALLAVMVGARQIGQLNVTPDTTVLLFTAAVSLASGVLFGLAPAFRASRSGLAHQLTETAAATTPRDRLAKVLVASQIALSVVLLFGAGLFVRTLRNLNGQQLGFEREDLLLFEVAPDRSGYAGARGIALHNQLRERIERLSGVRSVTFSEFALLTGWSNSSPGTTDRGPLTPPGQPDSVYYNRVGPRFFETMGVRVLLGRGIQQSDTDIGRPTAVVNESLARACFPNENPVGHRISVGLNFNPQKSYEIIGVVKDAKYDRMREAPPRTVYLSYGTTWDRTRRMCFAVRAVSDPLAITASVREAIRDLPRRCPGKEEHGYVGRDHEEYQREGAEDQNRWPEGLGARERIAQDRSIGNRDRSLPAGIQLVLSRCDYLQRRANLRTLASPEPSCNLEPGSARFTKPVASVGPEIQLHGIGNPGMCPPIVPARETGGRDAHHREDLPVQANLSAYYVRVGRKAASPDLLAQDGDRGPARRRAFIRSKQPAESWMLQAVYREEITGYQQCVKGRRIIVECRRDPVPCSQIGILLCALPVRLVIVERHHSGLDAGGFVEGIAGYHSQKIRRVFVDFGAEELRLQQGKDT